MEEKREGDQTHEQALERAQDQTASDKFGGVQKQKRGYKRDTSTWKRRTKPMKSDVEGKRKWTDGEKVWYTDKVQFPKKPWHDAMIEYMANPTDQRTVKKFSNEVGITNKTYYNTKKRYRDILMKLVDERRKKYIPALREEAFKALGERLSQSDTAIRMALEMTGDYTPKSVQKVEYESREEKLRKIKELLPDSLKDI